MPLPASRVRPTFTSPARRVSVALLVCLCLASVPARGADTVETLEDAYIIHDPQAGTWTIGAGGAALSLTLASSRDFLVTRLLSPSGRIWTVGAQADTTVTANGSTMPFGSRGQGFLYEDAITSNDGHVLRLDAVFSLRAANLRVTRHFVVASGSPSFEVWTTFQSLNGGTAPVGNMNGFQLTIPAGPLHWLTGNQGDEGDDSRDSAFMRRQQDLAIGETLALGAQGRSSEQTVPWLAVDGEQDEFYAALMWSGSWSLTARRGTAAIALSWGLPAMRTSVGRAPVDGPHAIFGVAPGSLADASAALRSYVLSGIRRGRALTPLVTFNTWFAHGTNVDDASMRAEMERAAAMGVELFVLDAGWYTGADTVDTGNFDQGLGSWEADAARFPDGLKALTDYAHSLGMKFGIWVEPTRVSLSVVGGVGVDERWLAKSGDSYKSDDSAEICLAGAAGRKWVVDHLTAFLDEVQPDYLKWDNNLWVNCDRPGHNHGATDGNFAGVTALYEILDALRQRFPELQIENCSGGGNRLDLGILRYTDVGWMDDHTAPSIHVRHNIEGLSAMFPPAYLLSFVTEAGTESLHDAPDLPLYFRSRMGGILGLCFLSESLSEADILAIVREVAIYKSLRTTQSVAAAALLTPQANASGGPDWDVLQATVPDASALVVYAFQENGGVETVNVRPTNLQPDATYSVISVDVGLLGTSTGNDIMANGIDVVGSPLTAAHILTLSTTP